MPSEREEIAERIIPGLTGGNVVQGNRRDVVAAVAAALAAAEQRGRAEAFDECSAMVEKLWVLGTREEIAEAIRAACQRACRTEADGIA